MHTNILSKILLFCFLYVSGQCVSDVMVSAEINSQPRSPQIRVTWGAATDICKSDEYSVMYELVNRDQCNANGVDEGTSGWGETISPHVIDVEFPYSTYRVTLMHRVPDGNGQYLYGENVDRYVITRDGQGLGW